VNLEHSEGGRGTFSMSVNSNVWMNNNPDCKGDGNMARKLRGSEKEHGVSLNIWDIKKNFLFLACYMNKVEMASISA